MIKQKFDCFVNDDKLLVFTATDVGSISGQAFEFYMTDASEKLIFKTAGSIADPGSSNTKAVINVDLTNLLEIPAAPYKWQLRRTTAGLEDTLAFGDSTLQDSFRDLI